MSITKLFVIQWQIENQPKYHHNQTYFSAKIAHLNMLIANIM